MVYYSSTFKNKVDEIKANSLILIPSYFTRLVHTTVKKLIVKKNIHDRELHINFLKIVVGFVGEFTDNTVPANKSCSFQYFV